MVRPVFNGSSLKKITLISDTVIDFICQRVAANTELPIPFAVLETVFVDVQNIFTF